MISIIESLRSKQKSLPLTLELMISLIEIDNKDIPDLHTLCQILNKTFDTEFTEDDIVFSTLSSYEEEDMRLQYKHLNII